MNFFTTSHKINHSCLHSFILCIICELTWLKPISHVSGDTLGSMKEHGLTGYLSSWSNLFHLSHKSPKSVRDNANFLHRSSTPIIHSRIFWAFCFVKVPFVFLQLVTEMAWRIVLSPLMDSADVVIWCYYREDNKCYFVKGCWSK